MICRSCDASLPEGTAFCISCGTPVTGGTAQQIDPSASPIDTGPRGVRYGKVSLFLLGVVALVVVAGVIIDRTIGSDGSKEAGPTDRPAATVTTVTTIQSTTTTLDAISAAKKANPGLFSVATELQRILTLSSQGRGAVGTVVGNVRNCSVTPDVAAREIDQVVANRQAVAQQLSTLSNTGGAESQEAIDVLRTAIRESILADQYFSSWMKYLYANYYYAVPVGCPNGSAPLNGSYESAQAASDRASAAKQQFVERFNPIAERFGQAQWSPGDI